MPKQKLQLKLFIWKDVLCDYTCGIMFAMAYDIEQARKLIMESMRIENLDSFNELNNEPEVHETAHGFFIYGGG